MLYIPATLFVVFGLSLSISAQHGNFLTLSVNGERLFSLPTEHVPQCLRLTSLMTSGNKVAPGLWRSELVV